MRTRFIRKPGQMGTRSSVGQYGPPPVGVRDCHAERPGTGFKIIELIREAAPSTPAPAGVKKTAIADVGSVPQFP
jgi:hypothetical protein